MRACSQEQESKLRVILLPRHQPVGLDVAFPLTVFATRQLVRAILNRQCAGSSEQSDCIIYMLQIKPSLQTAFQVFVEALGSINTIHAGCVFC